MYLCCLVNRLRSFHSEAPGLMTSLALHLTCLGPPFGWWLSSLQQLVSQACTCTVGGCCTSVVQQLGHRTCIHMLLVASRQLPLQPCTANVAAPALLCGPLTTPPPASLPSPSSPAASKALLCEKCVQQYCEVRTLGEACQLGSHHRSCCFYISITLGSGWWQSSNLVPSLTHRTACEMHMCYLGHRRCASYSETPCLLTRSAQLLSHTTGP